MQRHLTKDKNKEKKDKDKDKEKDKGKDKLMAERQTNAQERRIHELDQNVERYFEVRKRLGKGAYGIVWKATDKRKKDTVALKKIYDAFRDETDAQRTYREVVFLRAFRHHPNIIRMLDIFKAANNLDFYLVFEFMDSDLHNVIKKGDVLKDIHKRFVMYQLINAIKYMHSGNVVHRDLKPSNILIDSKCRLKVADFGLARTLCPKRRNNLDYDKDEMDNEAMLTDYVATRWYRAPEILVASRKYTKGIDMWSLGCILGEMLRQKPLFQGTSTINQIEKIVNALPEVTERDIESIGASFGSVLLSKKIVRDRRQSLDEMLNNCCSDAMSLVKSLLVLDPDGRLTAKEAIAHSYVHRFRTASANMELRTDIKPPLDDDVRYSVNDYRSTLYDMISPDMRSSARPGLNSSTQVTPTSTSELTHSTTRGLKSVSKSKQTASQEATAKSYSNYTMNWVEEQRKHQQQHHQQHQLKQKQQQPQRGKRFQGDQNQGARGSNHFAVEATPVGLRRELAAVAATAPRSVSGGLWQAPVMAQGQTPTQQQDTPLRLWTEPVPVPGPLPKPVPAAESESMATAGQLRARVRKFRKECKEQRQSKPKEVKETKDTKEHTKQQLQARVPNRNVPQKLAQTQAQEMLQTQSQARQLLEAKTLEMAKAELKLQEDRLRKEHKSVDLALTLERLQLEHDELQQKRNKVIEEQVMRQRPRKTQHKSNVTDDFYTPKGTVRQAKSTDLKMKQRIQDQLEGKINSGNAGAAIICYKTELNRLEDEMAKCKQQLFHYVQDNEQLLHKQSVRHHVAQLLQSSPSPPATASSRQTDSGVELERHQLQRQSLEQLQLERDKQKQLQLREFLARDEHNANAYELPNLSSVYKVSSCHALLLPKSQQQYGSQSQLQSQSQSQSPLQTQARVQTQSQYHGSSQSLQSQSKLSYSSYFNQEEDTRVSRAWNESKRSQQSGTYHDRMCIEEAKFYQEYEVDQVEHLRRS